MTMEVSAEYTGSENIHVNKISARKRVSCSALPPAVSENMALDSSTIYMKTGFLWKRLDVQKSWKKIHNHYKPGWEGKAWTPAEAHLPCTNGQRSKSAVFDSSRESGRGVFRCSLCLWRYQMWDVQGNGEGESVSFGKVALTVSAPGKVWKIELNLIPPLI